MKASVRLEKAQALSPELRSALGKVGMQDVTFVNYIDVEFDEPVEMSELFRMCYGSFTSLTNGGKAAWVFRMNGSVLPRWTQRLFGMNGARPLACVLLMHGPPKKLNEKIKNYLAGARADNGAK